MKHGGQHTHSNLRMRNICDRAISCSLMLAADGSGECLEHNSSSITRAAEAKTKKIEPKRSVSSGQPRKFKRSHKPTCLSWMSMYAPLDSSSATTSSSPSAAAQCRAVKPICKQASKQAKRVGQQRRAGPQCMTVKPICKQAKCVGQQRRAGPQTQGNSTVEQEHRAARHGSTGHEAAWNACTGCISRAE